MPTYTDRATRTLKLQKADRPRIGHGLPPIMEGFEGENRIQIVDGNPRLYYKTGEGWYYTGLAKDGADANMPTASATQLGVIKIGSGGTISSDGTYTATAATPAADDVTTGNDDSVFETSSGTVLIDSQASTTTIDGHAGVIIQGTNTKTITMGDGSSNFFVFNQDSTPEMGITGNFKMDCSGTVTIDADGGTITFSDDDSSLGTITNAGWTGDVVGDVTGTINTITVADESSDTSCNVLYVTAATGSLAPKSGTNLTFNSSSGLLTAGALSAATITQTSLAHVGSDTDKFIVSDSDVFKYRTGAEVASDIGLGSSSSPQFSTIELGDADDTTLARSSGGVVTIQGAVVRTGTVAPAAGGTGATDVPANGTILVGNGSSNTYDNTSLVAGDNLDMTVGAGTLELDATNTNQLTTFTLAGDSGSTQTISHGNTLTVAGGTGISTAASATDTVTVSLTTGNVSKLAAAGDPGADRILGWDETATGTEVQWMTAGNGLSIAGTALNVDFGDITTVGIVTSGQWRGTDVGIAYGGTNASNEADARTNLGLGDLAELDSIDISSHTNLSAGTNISLSGDQLNVDDAFLINNGNDTTSGTVTAAGFTTTGSLEVRTIDYSDGDLAITIADGGGITVAQNATFGGGIIQNMSNPWTKMVDTSSGGDDYGLNNNGSKFSIYNWTDEREELYFGGDGNATFTGDIIIDSGNNTKLLMGVSGAGNWEATYQRYLYGDYDGGAKYIRWDYDNNDPAGTNIHDNNSVAIVVNSNNNIICDSSGNVLCTNHVYAEADVWAYYSSDPILKENKELIDNPLEKICKLGGYSFDWKDEAEEIGSHLKGHDYGLMADEVQRLFPEMVHTRENGIRAVKYDKLVPLLIEGIKELKQELNMIKGVS